MTHLAVGTMAVSFSSANAAALTYSVNGQQVSKQISRFTLRGFNLSGHYLGGAVATCSNGQPILIFDTLTIAQNGASAACR